MIVCRSEGRLDREIRKKIALFAVAARSRRSSRPATSTTSTRCRWCFRAEGVDDLRPRPLRHRGARRPTSATGRRWSRRADAGRGHGADRARRQVRPARRRLPVGDRGARATAAIHHGVEVEVELGRLRGRSTPERRRASGADGILIPGGFGERGIEGKIRGGADRPRARDPVPRASASACRSRSSSSRATSPAWTGANSTEFDPETPYPVIDLLPEQKEVADMGGTMRLGADPVKLHDGHAGARDLRRGGHLRAPPPPLRGQQPAARAGSRTRAWSVGGTSPDERLVEIVELPDHPFFVASQFHPEFKSRPEPARAAVPRVRRRAAMRARGEAGRASRGAERGREAQPRTTSGGRARPVAPASATRRSADGCSETFVRLCEIPSPTGRGARGRRPRRPPSCARSGSRSSEDDAAGPSRRGCGQPARAACPGAGEALR